MTQYLLDTQPGLYKVLAATTGIDTTRFVHGPTGIHAQENPDDEWLWMVQASLGSVTGVVDADLNLLENLQYAPHGEVWEQSGTIQTPYQFTGEWVDQNDLLYLRARYLNPVLGTFLNLDPLETANRYTYAKSNPSNFIDPTGLSPACSITPTGTPPIGLFQEDGGYSRCVEEACGFLRKCDCDDYKACLEWCQEHPTATRLTGKLRGRNAASIRVDCAINTPINWIAGSKDCATEEDFGCSFSPLAILSISFDVFQTLKVFFPAIALLDGTLAIAECALALVDVTHSAPDFSIGNLMLSCSEQFIQRAIPGAQIPQNLADIIVTIADSCQ